MSKNASPRLALASLLTGILLTAIFAGLLIPFRNQLRTEIRQKIIERDAAVLHPVALQQLAEVAARAIDSPGDAEQLTPVLRSAQQQGMLAVAVFDDQGNPIHFVPASMLFVELPVEDYLELSTNLKPLSRYHAEFDLNQTFPEISPAQSHAPVLEVLLPLHFGTSQKLAGVARYIIDARALSVELAALDERIDRETTFTIAAAAALIGLVLTAAYFGLRRAQRTIAERNEKILRTNFELTLSVKASALGQITSHLIHGLQGSVAGLAAITAGRSAEQPTDEDWKTAATYTQRMQAIIHEAVALLGDSAAQTTYELTGDELADIIRRRNTPTAEEKGINFSVSGGFKHALDSHRGSLLCLITTNLVQNSIEATPAGCDINVSFRNGGDTATVTVKDEGHGIPAELRPHIFEAGRTGRRGGTGLGLAISQLLARQINATLELDSTGPAGTTFKLTVPLN
ncbi:sensor histidine kinase [Oleiharenicola lentus]|uniref:sensor histidine kinase n=1 Tax=Oleiharenicola lentus TaxID=2508720 RepID=UPI003F6628BF